MLEPVFLEWLDQYSPLHAEGIDSPTIDNAG